MTRKNITIGALLIIVGIAIGIGIGWGIARSSISIIAGTPRALPVNDLKLQVHRTLANSEVVLNRDDLNRSEKLDGARRTKVEHGLLRGDWLTRLRVFELATQLDHQRRQALSLRFNPETPLNLTNPLNVALSPNLHLELIVLDGKKPALLGVLNLT